MANKVILDQQRLFSPMEPTIITPQEMYTLYIPAGTLTANSRIKISTVLGRVNDPGAICPDILPPCVTCNCPDGSGIGKLVYNGGTTPGGLAFHTIASTNDNFYGVVLIWVPAQNGWAFLRFENQPLDDSNFGSTLWIDDFDHIPSNGSIFTMRQGIVDNTVYSCYLDGFPIFYGEVDSSLADPCPCISTVSMIINNPI